MSAYTVCLICGTDEPGSRDGVASLGEDGECGVAHRACFEVWHEVRCGRMTWKVAQRKLGKVWGLIAARMWRGLV